MALLALIVLIVFLLSGCAKKEEPTIEPLPAPAVVVSAPSLPDQPPSAPTRPQPPRAKVALIQAVEPLPNVEPISIVLGGGDYDITYETADNIPDLDSLETRNVFIANYKTNTTAGDPHSADVYVLIGSLKIQIDDIAESDHLYSNILSRGKDVNAYFNFATSERGPPGDKKNRRVIVVGELQYIGLPERYGTSKNTIDYLNLNPSEESQKEYAAALAKYEADVTDYRVAMESWHLAKTSIEPATIAPVRESEFHPPSSEYRPPASEYRAPAYHPPAYHPPPRGRP